MGMSNDEIVETLSDMQMTDETLYSHLSDTDKHLIDKRNTSLKKAIGAITKYQKIQEILNSASYVENGTVYSYTYDEDSRVKHIREVLEDGNNN